MNHRPDIDNAHRPRRALLKIGLALALAGCGGGGGGVDSGGTGAAVFASGTITGFGSIVVGNVHFDDSRASVTDADGTSRSRDDLRLGMTTEVRGGAIANDASGAPGSSATSIVFGSDLLGAVATIDRTANQLTVLGQTVDINTATVFDATSLLEGFSALAVGDGVEVYALFDAATGRYTATRIERKTVAATFVLRGPVSQLDTSAKAFDIGSARISYAGFTGSLPAALANGAIVRVRLRTTQAAGVWIVSTLADGVQRPSELEDARLEGRVTTFVSARLFSVNGVAVDAGTLAPAGLALGVRVEVEGTSRGGVLVANKVEVKTDDQASGRLFELRGAVESPDAATLSFVVRGVTVVYSATTTEFKKGTAAGLVANAGVDVRGRLSADGTRLLATRIDFR